MWRLLRREATIFCTNLRRNKDGRKTAETAGSCKSPGDGGVWTGMFKNQVTWWVLLLMQPMLAEVELAPLFQNGAVLQRDKAVPVWGRAEAGGTVSVSFGGQSKTTTADRAGRWQVSLDAMPASAESRTLTVTENGVGSDERPGRAGG